MSAKPSQDVAGILLPPSHSAPETQPKLNPRREAFVRHYLETGNATKAATLAGYSEKSAAAAGSRLLTNLEIKGAIDNALLQTREKAAREGQVSAQYCVDTLKSEIEHVRSDPERGPSASQAVARLTELLGKTIGLYTDRQEQDTQITVTIERIGG